MGFTKQQLDTLKIVCNTFIPSIIKEDDPDGYWKREATDLPIIEQITEVIEALPEKDCTEFLDLLDLLSSKKLSITWFGPLKGIQDLSQEERETLLRSWSKSSIPLLRQGYVSLKKLVSITYFGGIDSDNSNPNWKTIEYPGLLKGAGREINKTKTIKIQRPTNNQILSCDVVVIGSGAGGGVVAAELSSRGKDVIILEKGPYVDESKMNANESTMFKNIYDRKGALTSKDGAVTVLAGSCIGGGTTVNWSASFRTPDYILEEWAREHDLPHFIDPEYKKCFKYIEKRTNINKELSIHNHQNQTLINGAKKLDYHFDTIARNVAPPNDHIDKEKYWKSQGYGGLGDSFGYKMSTMKTFITDAVEHGARIFAKTRVETITHSNSEVNGVIAYQTDENGHQVKITISCKKVVLSAGAIHTPAILIKSGIKHPELGKNLYLHPTNAVTGVYKEPVEAWHGPMMSAVSDQFTRLDGNFGYKIETPPLHSGFGALSIPWVSGEQFKREMLEVRYSGNFIVLTRDKYGGKITVDKNGRTEIHYKLHKYDRNHLVHGLQESAKIHRAAGSKKIKLLHNDYHVWEEGKEDFDLFLKRIGKVSWAANRFILYSAHQMGTCRMGGRDKDHPVKPNGELRAVKNLYVADASVFPKCSGANPMLSTQALAYYISKQIE